MSVHHSFAPRRAGPRSSHLRDVSNSGSDTPQSSRPMTANSDTGTVQHDPLPVKLERNCVLWVHDENFSKDDVILNMALHPDLQTADLMAIVASKPETSVRDFQDKVQGSSHEVDNPKATLQRERTHSNPQSPIAVNSGHPQQDAHWGKRYLFVAKDMPKEMKTKHPNLELSVAKHIADVFCLKHRSNVLLMPVDPSECSASHVELSFRDEYLARSDMWRLTIGELSTRTVFKGQKILFMGTVKAHVTAVYVDGCKVQSAFFSAQTKPIFRSESARYVLFIQMSREMWDFDSEGSGEIMFNKVVNGFLPALFKKWAALKAKHLVSIVLFTRVEYDIGIASNLSPSGHDHDYHTGIQADGSKKPYKDFYRVVVSEMASGSWTTILYQLKREFKFFRRDISMHRIETCNGLVPTTLENLPRGALGTQIEAEPSLAMHGNVLEAINLASSQFAHDYIDRDLMRTGISIVVITPCPGLFEVDYETLKMTTENLIGNGIGIDLVCLPKMPLHSVPLFRYRNPQYGTFTGSTHLGTLRSDESTPRQNTGIFSSSYSSLSESVSPSKASLSERALRFGSVAQTAPPSEWSYAIPHWIDVSFWTGASQDTSLKRASTKVPKQYIRSLGVRRRKEFAVRCKMYEVEMASVMESGMTEIAVMPLHHDPLVPNTTTGPQQIATKIRDQDELRGVVERTKPYTSLFEFVNGPSKPLVDRHTKQDSKSFWKALETFDLNKSELLPENAIARHSNGNTYVFTTGSEEAAKRLLANDPNIFGTSYDGESKAIKGATLMATTLESPQKYLATDVTDKPRRRKTSVGSGIVVNSKPPPARPSKIGRQISLGKFGIGIAAPSAATAELQMEHVNAAPASNNSTNRNLSNSANPASSNLLHARSQSNDRPMSSQGENSKPKQSKIEPVAQQNLPASEPHSSTRPMTIKSALQSLDSTNQFKSRSVLGSLYEDADKVGDPENAHIIQSLRTDDTQKLYNSKLLAGSVPELPTTLSPTTALAPWLSPLNPSNPSANYVNGPSQYRRWQHVFPRPILTKTMKWKSLCAPASVPLTTEYFPTKNQLDTEYHQKPYTISPNSEEDLSENPKSREDFLRDLIGLRLSHGFQIVVGPAVAEAFGQKSLKIARVFERDCIAEDGVSVFMSLGNIIHHLSCVNETEVEVNMFVRKPTASKASSPSGSVSPIYHPAIRTTLAEGYESRQIMLGRPREEYNWNYVDAYIAGFDEEMTEHLRFWRARFVLIPVQRPTQSQRHQGEDNEEEIRLEGIKRLTQLWQRHRIVTASERRHQTLAARKTKDPNPLDIVYKTEDPSIVVSAEIETLPLVETGEPGNRRGQLIETERFRKAKPDIAALADAIQAPVEKGGVRVQNRRWHFRLHYNCFIGSDMTTWLIENFEDIETREEAVEFGNKLMVKEELQRIKEHETPKENGKEKEKDLGIFMHVEKRHPFRDGQYFYQVAGDFAKQRPESRSGWFTSKKRDSSIPSTPMSESMSRDSPRPERSRSTSHHDDRSSGSGATTPTTVSGGKKPKVALSKVMKYDIDHRKRSYRPERINLHYDRLHNPDNCYHIRIDWMSVTAKLIEDAIASWAATAERYGLRLVEAPIGEACSITSVHPFRSPYVVELAAQPPELQPPTYFDVNTFGPHVATTPSTRHYYQKAIMKKFNFVLDIEAARNFPKDVDVVYSWGKPDFKYTQYIHRSGIVLAQITDEGNFLLLANRLYNNRTAAAREVERYLKSEHVDRNSRIGSAAYNTTYGLTSDKTTPIHSPALRPVATTTAQITSPVLRATSDVLGPSMANSKIASITTPESVKNELEAFCHNASVLEAFYKEVLEKATPPNATPPSLKSPYAGSLLDSNIPTLGLPPNVLARDSSPSPMRLSSVPGVGSSMPYLGRRPSVQTGVSSSSLDGVSGKSVVDSPRGSISEGERS